MRVGKSALSVFLSIVLVVGLCPGLAYADEGGDLAAGAAAGIAPIAQAAPATQSSEGIAYDTVYGVVGGEYSLMMKTVEYEAVEDGETRSKSAIISDIVRADGQVVLHTSTADEDNDEVPGKYTDLMMSCMARDDHWLGDWREEVIDEMSRGYFYVVSKETGKQGLVLLDGTTLLPCGYISIEDLGGGVFACVKPVGETAVVSIVNSESGSIASFEQRMSSVSNSSATSASIYRIRQSSFYVSISWDGSWQGLYFLKQGDEWVVSLSVGIADVMDNPEPCEYLVKKTDGTIYYCDASGSEVKLDNDDSYRHAEIIGDFIVLKQASGQWGTNNACHFFNKSGKKLGFGPYTEYSFFYFDGYIMGGNNEDGYKLYDANGALYREFNGGYACPVGGRYNKNETRYTLARLRQSYDEDDEEYYDECYEVDVYNLDGSLVKKLDAEGNTSFSLDNIYSSYTGNVIGYTYNGTYFDLDFNKLSGDPRENEADPNPLKLADGTVVKTSAEESYRYGDDGQVYWSVTTSVKDAQGQDITRDGYRLEIAGDAGLIIGKLNSVKHGNADIWWAQDSAGKFGAIDSYGNVKVPFEYDSYYDTGNDDTDYAMVKRDGVWGFYNLSTGKATWRIVPIVEAGQSGSTVPSAGGGGSPSAGKPAASGTQKPAGNAGGAAGAGDNPGKGAAAAKVASASAKSANPMKVKAKTVTLKAKKLKKRAQSVKASKAFSVTGAQGKVTYKVAKYDKKAKKKIAVSKSGKVTAKKGLAKGTYKLKVKVSAAGDATHEPAAKTVTLKVKVK